ncbi:hypothetical protein BLA15816_01106 [Burkholderia lata]|nr:hypothetical protein BLA15816_01106 [Burkholderia lata]
MSLCRRFPSKRLRREIVWPYPVDLMLRSFLSRLRFVRSVPLSSLDSPRASNADPFSCLLAFRVSRLFSSMAAFYRLSGGMRQGFGMNRQRATVLHWCNVSTSSCPHALQGRSIPITNDGVGIFFARIPLHWQRVAAVPDGQAPTLIASDVKDANARDRTSDRFRQASHRLISPKVRFSVVPGQANTVSFERGDVEFCMPQRAVYFATRRPDRENKQKE